MIGVMERGYWYFILKEMRSAFEGMNFTLKYFIQGLK